MLSGFLHQRLERIFGSEGVSVDFYNLQEKSLDLWPRNLLYSPGPLGMARAVVRPNRDNYKKQLAKLIKLVRECDFKIIVRGGGSGVCGAANANGGEILVDITGVDGIEIIKKPTDASAGLVAVGAGVFGDRLNAFLGMRAYTCGHYPASLAVSTVGGWISTGASGHFSCYFGNIENIVESVEAITGKGEIVNLTGEDLKKVLRMEGTTAIITKVVLKIVKQLVHDCFQTFRFNSFERLTDFLQTLAGGRNFFDKKGVKILAVRAYDPIDYRLMSKPNKGDSEKPAWIEKTNYWLEKTFCSFGRSVELFTDILERLGSAPWTVVVYSVSDFADQLEQARGMIEVEALARRGISLGPSIAHSWYKNRFKLDYDKLARRFSAGIIVDTFDCSPTWDKLADAYYLIRSKLFEFGVVGAHIGLDKDRPYIYFIFGVQGDEQEKYDRVWNEILRECAETVGINITHHHGIGKLRRGKKGSLIQHAYGGKWLDNAKAVKGEYDPDNILNPANMFNTGQ